jgi:hypothetical protein
MTCSKECRLRRRAKQKKARRALNLTDERASDCARQRKRRARQRGEAGEPRSMSRPGLSPQVADAIREIMQKVRQAQQLSRPGLGYRLRRLAQVACGCAQDSPPEK